MSLEEAATAGPDPLGLTVADRTHSVDEERFVLLGRSHPGRLPIVGHAADRRHVRIVSTPANST